MKKDNKLYLQFKKRRGVLASIGTLIYRFDEGRYGWGGSHTMFESEATYNKNIKFIINDTGLNWVNTPWHTRSTPNMYPSEIR